MEDVISHFDPWQVSPQELVFRLAYAWQTAVGRELEDREGFQGLSQADPGETRRLQRNFEPEDRLNLAWASVGLSILRMPCIISQTTPMMIVPAGFVVNWIVLSTGSGIVLIFKLLGVQGPFLMLMLQRWRLLSPCGAGSCGPALLPGVTANAVCEAPTCPMLDLFTDGSCWHPAEPNIRLASWAVIVAAEPGDYPITAASGPLSGVVQTAFRAEITALLAAFQCMVCWQTAARIWSDCAGVVRRAQLLQAGELRCYPSMPNFDLWSAIVEMAERAPSGWSVHKVAAHKTAAHRDPLVDEWACWNNQAADREAARAN